MDGTVRVRAPAKINLTLHVTGRRRDGYHLLDSLVAFADACDTVLVEESDALAFTIDGPEAGRLTAEPDNLVLRAARLFGTAPKAAITLTKVLPVASGIGGGSADAAATLHGLSQLWACPLPPKEEVLGLGADVPVCVAGRPARMQGVGEIISHVPTLPDLDILLVNPRVPVATKAVFAGLASTDNPGMGDLPDWLGPEAFAEWLAGQRNDLLAPALALAPEIGIALGLIRDTDCLFAGMSGSGATCFGLYLPGTGTADVAQAHVQEQRPDWWAMKSRLLR